MRLRAIYVSFRLERAEERSQNRTASSARSCARRRPRTWCARTSARSCSWTSFRSPDGHTLIIPKAHCDDIFGADPEDLRAVIDRSREVAHAIGRVLAPDGLGVFQLNGAAAGQTVFHYHMHLIPRNHGAGAADPQPHAGRPDAARRDREAPRRGAAHGVARSLAISSRRSGTRRAGCSRPRSGGASRRPGSRCGSRARAAGDRPRAGRG